MARQTQEERDEELRKKVEAYRRVFNTADGRFVLGDILNDLRFFADGSGVLEIDVERMRIARQILAKCGIWQTGNIGRMTGLMFELPWETSKESDNGSGSDD